MTTCPMCAEDISVHDTVCPHCASLLPGASPVATGGARSADATAAGDASQRAGRSELGTVAGGTPGRPSADSEHPRSILAADRHGARMGRGGLTMAAIVVGVLTTGVVGWVVVTRWFGGWWCAPVVNAWGGTCFQERLPCEEHAKVWFEEYRSDGDRCAHQWRVWCVAFTNTEVLSGPQGPSCYATEETCRNPPQAVYEPGDRPANHHCLEVSLHSLSALTRQPDSAAIPGNSAPEPQATTPPPVVGRATAIITPTVTPPPRVPPPPSAASTLPDLPVTASAPLVRLSPARVEASSFIRGAGRRHGPERAFDGDPATAWNESAAGAGAGSWISATFASPVRVGRLRVTTGWDMISPRSGDLFAQNSHLRRVRITFDGRGTIEREVGAAERTVEFGNLDERAGTVRVEAVDVWPGTRWADLCISEIVIEGSPAPTTGSNGPSGTRHRPRAAPRTSGAAREW